MTKSIVTAWGINGWVFVFGASSFLFLFSSPQYILVALPIGVLAGFIWAKIELWNNEVKGGAALISILCSSLLAFAGYILGVTINLVWIKLQKGWLATWWEPWLVQVFIIVIVISLTVGIVIGFCGNKAFRMMRQRGANPALNKALLLISFINLFLFCGLPMLSLLIGDLAGKHWFDSLMRFG